MEARLVRAVILCAAFASLGASYRTPNFLVQAPTPELAREIGQAAETFRRDLAIEWLGKPMPNWTSRCPITAQVGRNYGAGGATSFMFDEGEVFGWQMSIQGSRERILDSVLPHEITHTIFACHFRAPLPRWADEGACTTVEHASEKAKQKKMLIEFLQTGRGISFNRMFSMKEYPRDVLPLYSQGYSLVRFLIAQSGKQEFLAFVGDGMQSENWPTAVREHYGFESLWDLQGRWLDWVRQGSPKITPSDAPAALLVAQAKPRKRPSPNLIYRAQSTDPPRRANAGRLVPVPRGWVVAGERLSKPADAKVASHEVAPPATPTPTPLLPDQHQTVRPQYPQRAKQIIFEWSHPARSAPPPSTGKPRPSVYDTSVSRGTRLR